MGKGAGTRHETAFGGHALHCGRHWQATKEATIIARKFLFGAALDGGPGGGVGGHLATR